MSVSWPHRCVRDWVSHKSLTTLGLGRQTSFFLPKHNHQSQRCVLKKKAFLFKYAGVQSTGGKLWEGSHPNGDTSLAFWVRFGWTYHIQRWVKSSKSTWKTKEEIDAIAVGYLGKKIKKHFDTDPQYKHVACLHFSVCMLKYHQWREDAL